MVNPVADASNVMLVFPAASPALADSLAAASLFDSSMPALAPFSAARPADLKGADQMSTLVMSLESLIGHFKDFEVAEIELSVTGAIETNGLLRLAVAAKGEGGVRILLKPSEKQ